MLRKRWETHQLQGVIPIWHKNHFQQKRKNSNQILRIRNSSYGSTEIVIIVKKTEMRITLQRDDMNSSKVNVKKDEPWYILGTHVIKTILVLESTRLFIGQLKCAALYKQFV